MAQRASKPVTVTLGPLGDKVRERVETGGYASVSEVVRAGLRALEREEAALDARLRVKVRNVLDNPIEWIPHEQVFANIEELYRQRTGK